MTKNRLYWVGHATASSNTAIERLLNGELFRCFLCGKFTYDFRSGIIESLTKTPYVACEECAKTPDEALSKLLNKLLLEKFREPMIT